MRGKRNPKQTELRWKFIEDENLDTIVRCKLLEQFTGRFNVDYKRVQKLLKHEDSLIRLSANNLSAALNELANGDA